MSDSAKAILIAAFIVMVALAAGAAPAAAQQPLCTERSEVINRLSSQYAEMPVAMGVANNGGVIEIFTAPAGTTWTIILTMPNGITCMIAAGESWEALPPKIAEKKS